MVATRRQRARAASNTGEQALLVLRKNFWIGALHDVRTETVCRAAALADDTYGSFDTGEGRISIDAETAQRLVLALGTAPPPFSDTDEISACRARHAARRACEAATVIFRLAQRGAAGDGVNLLLKAGFVPATAAVYRRAVSVALQSETMDAGRIEAFELASCATKLLEVLVHLPTTRVDVCADYLTLGVIETCSAVLVAAKHCDSPPLAHLEKNTLCLLVMTFLGLRDLSSIDASLVRDIGSYVSKNNGSRAVALLGLHQLAEIMDTATEPAEALPVAMLKAFCEPTLVEAIADALTRGTALECGIIIMSLRKATSHVHAFATPRIVCALLEVISLDSAEAREAYDKKRKYGANIWWQKNIGYVTTGDEQLKYKLLADEICLSALLGLIKADAFAAAPELEAALVGPILDKLRASFVDPTPGPNLFNTRAACLGILAKLAPRHAREIVKVGGVQLAIDSLVQLKLPGSTAVREQTVSYAWIICSFLKSLAIAGPNFEDIVRRGLKEFASRPELETYIEHSRTTLTWFIEQLENAPGGPPEWLEDGVVGRFTIVLLN